MVDIDFLLADGDFLFLVLQVVSSGILSSGIPAEFYGIFKSAGIKLRNYKIRISPELSFYGIIDIGHSSEVQAKIKNYIHNKQL